MISAASEFTASAGTADRFSAAKAAMQATRIMAALAGFCGGNAALNQLACLIEVFPAENLDPFVGL